MQWYLVKWVLSNGTTPIIVVSWNFKKSWDFYNLKPSFFLNFWFETAGEHVFEKFRLPCSASKSKAIVADLQCDLFDFNLQSCMIMNKAKQTDFFFYNAVHEQLW